MPKDLVIDTNVLVHASNSKEKWQEESVKLIEHLLNSDEVMRVDPVFTGDPSTNTSYVGYEYLKHLRSGMIGYSFISLMAASKRIVPCSRATHSSKTRAINQCMTNNHDRVFIKVAINSDSKILVTHDFTDFAKNKRTYLHQKFELKVIVAKEYPKSKFTAANRGIAEMGAEGTEAQQ